MKDLNSWQIIRRAVLLACPNPIGSYGSQLFIRRAAEVFVALHDSGRLVDDAESIEAFNRDEEARIALLLPRVLF